RDAGAVHPGWPAPRAWDDLPRTEGRALPVQEINPMPGLDWRRIYEKILPLAERCLKKVAELEEWCAQPFAYTDAAARGIRLDVQAPAAYQGEVGALWKAFTEEIGFRANVGDNFPEEGTVDSAATARNEIHRLMDHVQKKATAPLKTKTTAKGQV